MHRVLALAGLSALLAGGAAGCPGKLSNPERFTGDSGALPSTCALGIDVESELLARRCTGSVCHGAGAPQNGLDLETPGAGDRMVDTPAAGCSGQLLIDSAAPARSFILAKLRGTEPDDCGAPMPLDQDPLSPDEYDCVAAWVGQKAGLPGGGGDGGSGGGGDAGAGDPGAGVDAALAGLQPWGEAIIRPVAATLGQAKRRLLGRP